MRLKPSASAASINAVFDTTFSLPGQTTGATDCSKNEETVADLAVSVNRLVIACSSPKTPV